MLERNKLIFYILLAISAIVFVADLLLHALLVHAPLSSKLLEMLGLATIELICIAAVIYSRSHPNANRQYKFKIINSRPQMIRKTYPPDPNGWRYISHGVIILVITLLFLGITLGLIFAPLSDKFSLLFGIGTGILIGIIAGFTFWCEKEIKQDNGNSEQ